MQCIKDRVLSKVLNCRGQDQPMAAKPNKVAQCSAMHECNERAHVCNGLQGIEVDIYGKARLETCTRSFAAKHDTSSNNLPPCHALGAGNHAQERCCGCCLHDCC
eukprot:13866-Heterococcus_DN1.PRE.1